MGLFILLLSLSVFAETDVEDQIRMAEDPHYLDYLRERDREEASERAAGYEHKKTRAKEEAEEERARRDYVKWKARQPKENYSKEEAADLKAKIAEEKEYLKLERTHAEYKYREERQMIVAQEKILSMNRRPASLMPPRAPRKQRKFTGTGAPQLKMVTPPTP